MSSVIINIEVESMQKIIYKTEIQDHSNEIDQSIIDYINSENIETFESFDTHNLIAFNWYDVNNNYRKTFKVIIYIDKDDLFFIVDNEKAKDTIEEFITFSDDNENTLFYFFRNILRGNTKFLEELEMKIGELDEEAIKNTSNLMSLKIVKYKNRILSLKRYYEQFEFLFDEICDNDNGLFTNKCLKYFDILHNRALRFVSQTVTLRDYLSQIREAYQAAISNEQSKLMKLFTLITSIFMPLTLIVGWYGMNLKMPEFTWDYGYVFVIILSIVVSIIWFIVFKNRKWFK